MDRLIPRQPALECEMDGALSEGTGIAFAIDGLQHQVIRVPLDRVPDWAVKLVLSPEDYGKMIRFAANPRN